MSHIRKCLVCLGIIASSYAIGQDNDQMPIHNSTTDTYYKYSLQLGAEVPYPISDHAFQLSLVGIYSFHIAPQFSITKHLYAGLEFQDAEFALGTNPIYSLYATEMFAYQGGVDLGYHTSMGKDFMSAITLLVGQSRINYSDPPIHVGVAQPTFYNINFFEGYKVDDDIRIGLELSFTSFNYAFDPFAIGFTNATYVASDVKSPTIYIAWGFGFYYGFGKGKGGI